MTIHSGELFRIGSMLVGPASKSPLEALSVATGYRPRDGFGHPAASRYASVKREVERITGMTMEQLDEQWADLTEVAKQAIVLRLKGGAD